MREAPRLRRGLHYPSVPSFPNSLAIDSTLSASPFARVPPSVANDPIISSTIAQNSHLFAISTPFNLVALRLLLRPHPNRALVESVLHGLEFGFWPSHSGDFTGCRSIFPELENDDYDFLADVAQKEFDEGCLSEHFPSLLPGMLVSPSYVVNVPGRKRRQVVDQSASGLNDGIARADAKTSYDTIAELGALFRYLAASLPSSSFPLGHLWKSDVSRAFRNIPVAKEWQMKQVHRVRLMGFGGGKVFVFTVDQRLILGGRLSPRIWCTVINLVMWIARHHFSLSHAFIFVDDGFSYDTSGLLVTINHPITNKEMVVPMEQAKLLLCWKVCGVPYEVKKQVHSDSALEILGCWVDIASKSVTLPREKKEEFAGSVASFLADLSPPLIDWQRIAGYAQWACYTAPLAKFALKPLYPKMAGKKLRNAPVPINKEVKTNLRWFAETILVAPPLFFLDPCLDEWSPKDADAIYYSDACLVSNNGSSGLGFWTRQYSGATLDYFHRAPSKFEDIQLAEALAVASAIQHAVTCVPRPRRLLVYSDSAPSVYAFDAGRGSPSLVALVWRAYTCMEEASIDFRIRHIAGDKNTRADRLSRLHPSELASDFPSLTSFSPPAWALGGDNRHRSPPPSLAELVERRSSLILNAVEPSTRRGYSSSLKHWTTFLKIYNFSSTPTPDSLSLFVAFLSSRVKEANKVLSALAHHLRPSMPNWDDVRNHPLVESALRGSKKTNASPPKRARPLRPPELASLVSKAISSRSYDHLLVAFIASLGFSGVMRLGELTEPQHKGDRTERKICLRDGAFLEHDKLFQFELRTHKGDREHRGSTVVIVGENSTSDFNVIKLAEAYLARRDARHGRHPRLLLRYDGSPPPRHWFLQHLVVAAPGASGHSLRAGGATFLASRGVPGELIKRMGRWSSSSWESYIRNTPSLAAALQRQALRAAPPIPAVDRA